MKLKPGISTTEFWVTVAGVAIQGTLTAFGMLDATWAALGITFLGGLYNFLRAVVKRGDQEVQAAALKVEAANIAALKREFKTHNPFPLRLLVQALAAVLSALPLRWSFQQAQWVLSEHARAHKELFDLQMEIDGLRARGTVHHTALADRLQLRAAYLQAHLARLAVHSTDLVSAASPAPEGGPPDPDAGRGVSAAE